MESRNPRVSVVVPAYNSVDYTVETVESVLAQTYRDFELIVVDDGSIDDTRVVLSSYGDRLQYIYKENGGACSARNVGIRHARGEYIACLDCDDLWLPEKLEYSLSVLETDPQMGFVFTPCYTIDSEGNPVGKVHFPFDLQQAYVNLLMENFVMAPTVLMRRACLEEVGLFDENIFIPADWDLWLRLAYRFQVGYVDRPLSKYRLASNYTLRNVKQFVREANYVLEKQFRIADALSQRERARIRAQLLLTHALLYLKAEENDSARLQLRQAICLQPCNWRPYGYYFLSLLGKKAYRVAAAVRRKLSR